MCIVSENPTPKKEPKPRPKTGQLLAVLLISVTAIILVSCMASAAGTLTCSFSMNKTSFPDGAPACVQFNYTGSGATSWDWHFSDGGTATTNNTTHTFTSNGIYGATLIVGNGSADARCDQLDSIVVGPDTRLISGNMNWTDLASVFTGLASLVTPVVTLILSLVPLIIILAVIGFVLRFYTVILNVVENVTGFFKR